MTLILELHETQNSRSAPISEHHSRVRTREIPASVRASSTKKRSNSDIQAQVQQALANLDPRDRVWIETAYGLGGRQEDPSISEEAWFNDERTKRILRELSTTPKR